MSKFWEHYEAAKPHLTNAVDDVRHKLVEEAWFGRQTTGSINEGRAGEGAQDPLGWRQPKESALGWSEPEKDGAQDQGHKHAALYEEVWGPAPRHADIYGQAPKQEPGPSVAAPAPQKDPGHGPDF